MNIEGAFGKCENLRKGSFVPGSCLMKYKRWVERMYYFIRSSISNLLIKLVPKTDLFSHLKITLTEGSPGSFVK